MDLNLSEFLKKLRNSQKEGILNKVFQNMNLSTDNSM
jgi:hypothetical protein